MVSKKEKPRHAAQKKNRLAKKIAAGIGIGLGAFILVIVAGFLTIFYSPWFPQARDQYILMTYHTSNPWLCTLFFSQEQIDDAYNRNQFVSPEGETDVNLIDTDTSDTDETKQSPFATSDVYPSQVIYEDEGTQIIQFSGTTKTGKYTARIIQILDPSRVVLGITNQLGDKDNPKANPGRGQQLRKMLGTNDALCGINAGGFLDIGGVGTGGIPMQITIKDHVVTVYEQRSKYMLIGFNDDNVLVLGKFTLEEIKQKNIRDGLTWGPILILNGDKAISKGMAGGYDPRTAIGQRADGTVLLLVIDGSYRRGIDGGNMALVRDIMWEFGAVNAANLDGGTSATMALNGKVINSICNPLLGATGRYLATAWLVKNQDNDITVPFNGQVGTYGTKPKTTKATKATTSATTTNTTSAPLTTEAKTE